MGRTFILLSLLSLILVACNKKEQAGRVWFTEPVEKSEVVSPVTFSMNVEGMLVKPAGTMEAGTGHFHILINTDAIEAGQVIINDVFHKHYGKGQRADTIDLKPGDYRVTLQFADGAHISYGPKWSQTIAIKVVEKK
jgi:hypothetical protein